MRILIRADGDARIGAGHVMRMLALAAHARADEARVTLASARLSPGLAVRAQSLGVDLLDAPELEPGSAQDLSWLVQHATHEPDTWVCVDGYAFDASYQSEIVRRGLLCLWVDDDGRSERYDATLVLNANFYADPALYPHRSEQTQLLLGPRYAPLREEFTHAPPASARAAPIAQRILVTLGGADPVNATALVTDALCRIDDPALEIRVLVGPANPRADEIAARFTDRRLQIVRGTSDMVGLLAWAELAIAGAGTTTYELCAMGVPAMLLVLADNQAPVCRAAGEHGVAESLGWHHAFDPDTLSRRVDALRRDPATRQRMAERGRALVDGRGARRILDAMRAAEQRA